MYFTIHRHGGNTRGCPLDKSLTKIERRINPCKYTLSRINHTDWSERKSFENFITLPTDQEKNHKNYAWPSCLTRTQTYYKLYTYPIYLVENVNEVNEGNLPKVGTHNRKPINLLCPP